MEDIASIVSSLGFPMAIAIAAFFIYYKFVEKQMDACAKREETLMAQSNEREEKLGKQLDKFADALNNFNISLTKIDTRLSIIEKSVEERKN